MQPDNSKPPLRFRKLRIAWSVFWGLACVLLVVLWVRSYWRFDTVTAWIPERGLTTSSSAVGRVAIQFYNRAHLTKWGWSDRLKAGRWSKRSYEPDYIAEGIFAEQHGLPESPSDIVERASQPGSLSFAFETYKGSGFHLVLPHWFLLL